MAPLFLRFKGGAATEGPFSLGSTCLRLHWAQKIRKSRMTSCEHPPSPGRGKESLGCEGTSEEHLLEAGTPVWAVTSRLQLNRCRTKRILKRDVVTRKQEPSLLGAPGHLYEP